MALRSRGNMIVGPRRRRTLAPGLTAWSLVWIVGVVGLVCALSFQREQQTTARLEAALKDPHRVSAWYFVRSFAHRHAAGYSGVEFPDYQPEFVEDCGEGFWLVACTVTAIPKGGVRGCYAFVCRLVSCCDGWQVVDVAIREREPQRVAPVCTGR